MWDNAIYEQGKFQMVDRLDNNYILPSFFKTLKREHAKRRITYEHVYSVHMHSRELHRQNIRPPHAPSYILQLSDSDSWTYLRSVFPELNGEDLCITWRGTGG